ncbi:cyclase family protein [Ruegeria sp. THAF57]|uniref:cyclase family protein n=1 Tax=Ruegeria sp. THAF57 TaxID=2744555 RepID=UPI00210827F5|nr:cyclase family protein [Ruegeria sp. THAF57]
MFKFSEHGFNLQRLSVNEHTGTHIDAPLRFSADGASVDEISLSDLIAPLCAET